MVEIIINKRQRLLYSSRCLLLFFKLTWCNSIILLLANNTVYNIIVVIHSIHHGIILAIYAAVINNVLFLHLRWIFINSYTLKNFQFFCPLIEISLYSSTIILCWSISLSHPRFFSNFMKFIFKLFCNFFKLYENSHFLACSSIISLTFIKRVKLPLSFSSSFIVMYLMVSVN